MTPHRRIAAACLALGLAALCRAAAVSPIPAGAPAADEIVRLVLENRQGEPYHIVARLYPRDVRPNNPQARDVTPIPLDIFNSWQPQSVRTAYRITVPDVPPRDFLTVHEPARREWQAYLRAPDGQLVALEPGDLATRFADLDFTFEDLAFSFLYWPGPELQGADQSKTRPCWVLEHRPGPDTRSQYGRVRSWIDQEGWFPLRVECYGPDMTTLVRQLEVISVRREEGQWRLSKIEARDLQRRTRTRLEVLRIITPAPVAPDVFAGLPGAPPTPGSWPGPRLLLITIDGLGSEWRDWPDAGRAFPALTDLAERAAVVEQLYSVFPSVTYPAHATIATGAWPSRHGISNNTVWDPTLQQEQWRWFAADLTRLPLWDMAPLYGATTAAVQWPSTVGATIDWHYPEVWSETAGTSSLDLVRRFATSGLIEAVEADSGIAFGPDCLGGPGRDAWIGAAARSILTRHKPHIMLVHFVELDHAQHEDGPGSDGARQALAAIDAELGRILDTLDQLRLTATTLLAVCGDHGFLPCTRLFRPNRALLDAGLYSPDDNWQAFADVGGAGAVVYIAATSNLRAEKLSQLFQPWTDGADAPLEAIGLAQLEEVGIAATSTGRDGARPALGLSARPGWNLSRSPEGPVTSEAASPKGMHGQWPYTDAMASTLFLAGPGVREGAHAAQARLIDVAPTLVALLGWEFPPAQPPDGRPIRELLDESAAPVVRATPLELQPAAP